MAKKAAPPEVTVAKKAAPSQALRGAIATVSIPSSIVQNEFGRVLDQAMERDIVVTRHEVPRAVLVSARRYQQLVGRESSAMQSLQSTFDALYDRMQTPRFKAAIERGFRATPAQMGHAARAAAKRKARSRNPG